jgi:putative heme-binding domain-containing protein
MQIRAWVTTLQSNGMGGTRGLVAMAAGAVFVAMNVGLSASAAEQWRQSSERMPVVVPGGTTEDERAFQVPEGFAVERLFVVPRTELGSWVSLATDPAGRLIASDQADKGLVRITPAPLDGSGDTVVERIPVSITGAQGLLYAFDALYVVCSGGTGSGLYRVTDSDGDDMPDRVEKLRALDGEGEHGPHNIVLSPDGTQLFVVCGNHTRLPFTVIDETPPQVMGGIRDTQRRVGLGSNGRSRLPANWDEDVVIRRMWDGNGHAAGILAPGGYIAATDPDGESWEVWSAGYRNSYDLAFNADGELFAYDADMEWDFGAPWYRPTRVNHATSGSELGWRSGTAKWPASYADSLPALVDIGPGSPVGVCFGYGTRFPERYQRALYVCDWTFGTMYAIHLEPDGSTYAGTKQEFIARSPLPLTDVVVGRDGAMYFAVGGRGGQSELYRVVYAGSEPTPVVDGKDGREAPAREARRALESLHGPQQDPSLAVATALPFLASHDRFLRYAARVALEHQPLHLWKTAALAQDDPTARIEAAIAVARQAEPAAQPDLWAALDSLDPATLSPGDRLRLVRAYQLALIRLGEPAPEVRGGIARRFFPLFPAGSFDLDRELSSLLVAVRAPGIVSTLVSLMAVDAAAEAETSLAPDEEETRALIQRNAGYGEAVRATLDRRGNMLQMHYAYVLRVIQDLPDDKVWTAADRKVYYAWFQRARAWGGGNSFQRFLTNMEDESLAGLSENERLALEATGVRQPYVPPPLPAPEGPGRTWSVDEVLATAETGLAPGMRDYEKGKRAFAAARCIVCHRFDGDGGATGPDLTQAGGRFQIKDMVEAILEPSRIVSDQYRASIVQLTDGKVVTGRVVAEADDAVTIMVDPESAAACLEVARNDIEVIAASATSLMPAGLLDQLNEKEVLDLLAYTLSRGKRKDPVFRRGK